MAARVSGCSQNILKQASLQCTLRTIRSALFLFLWYKFNITLRCRPCPGNADDLYASRDMPRLPTYNEPLPTCHGPKLLPFENQSAAIKFIRVLSDQRPRDSSSEGRSYVFEVSILSKTYALKVVCALQPYLLPETN